MGSDRRGVVADVSAQIGFQATAWDDRAAADLAAAQTGPETLDAWRGCVKRGKVQLWAVLADGERIGTMAWEAYQDAGGGPVLAVLALAAKPMQGQTLRAVDAVFRAMAQDAGGATLRFNTARRGLVRQSERLGFSRRYVMEKEVRADGR